MTPRPVYLAHPSSLEHDTGGHPERAARIVAIEAELERRGGLGYERVLSLPVDRAVLERVHPAVYVDAIERAAAAGGGMLDADTLISRGSFTAALHAAGGAVELVARLLDPEGPAPCGFSAHRPPGHHALPGRAMGFCLFNNVAVAARYALDVAGLERVMILDWDVHHGNGTNDTFSASPEVLFVSIHQWPLYPGTGAASDVGSGEGRGFTVNLPVPRGSGDDVYTSLVRDVAVPLTRAHRPELLLISAGFDAHRDDPLAECAVTEAGFAAMTAAARDIAAELAISVGCVLEGGYRVDALARSVALTMEVLAGADPVATAGPVDLGEEPVTLAHEARARLAPYWPGLEG